MRFGFGAEQRMLADATRDLLAELCPPTVVRSAGDDGAGRMGALWRGLAELGLLGILVPEKHGGAGMTMWDAVLPFEELGRAAAPGPIVETALVAAGLLVEVPELGSALDRLAAGELVVAVRLRPDQYLLDADIADLLLVLDGDALHAVSPGGAVLVRQPGVDPSRHLFSLGAAARSAEGIASGVAARDLAAAAFDRGALGAAAQLLGLGQHLLDVTVRYARERRQFDRPIGSFQAVKHQLADATLALEFARPLVYRAAHTLSGGAATASTEVSAAASSAIDAAELAARVALQVHGAIGYTAEYDLQLWLKRVWSLRSAWGGSGWHRERVARAILGEPAGRSGG